MRSGRFHGGCDCSVKPPHVACGQGVRAGRAGSAGCRRVLLPMLRSHRKHPSPSERLHDDRRGEGRGALSVQRSAGNAGTGDAPGSAAAGERFLGFEPQGNVIRLDEDRPRAECTTPARFVTQARCRAHAFALQLDDPAGQPGPRPSAGDRPGRNDTGPEARRFGPCGNLVEPGRIELPTSTMPL